MGLLSVSHDQYDRCVTVYLSCLTDYYQLCTDSELTLVYPVLKEKFVNSGEQVCQH